MRKCNIFLKHTIDFIGSFLGLIIISPLLIVISIAIVTGSKGPILFRQKRLGKDGQIFEILKFRTMVMNAEQIGSGLFINSENDARITKIGKFLRTTSLDELPQIINVLKGDMSLVGPRPPVPHHPFKYDEYTEFQKTRFSMRPGMTGLAQVTVRNSVPWEERIPVDVDYVKNFNLWLDFRILFKTFFKIFKSESIYRA